MPPFQTPSEHQTNVPTISIITATFNLLDAGRRESFKHALDCVQAQFGTNLEHVIQDGASSDGTVEFINREIAGLTNVSVLSEPDTGLYDAMNRASSRAQGTYLLFLNSDDSIASTDALQKASLALAKTSADFAFGMTLAASENGEQSLKGCNLRATLQRMPFCHNSLLIRRDIFANLGGHNTSLKVAADYDMVLRLIASGHSGLELDFPISLYWTRGASANDRSMAQDYAQAWLDFYSKYPAGAAYSLDDYVTFYERGHLPLKLMYQVFKSDNLPPTLRQSARHSFAKSFRRTLQPWRFR